MLLGLLNYMYLMSVNPSPWTVISVTLLQQAPAAASAEGDGDAEDEDDAPAPSTPTR